MQDSTTPLDQVATVPVDSGQTPTAGVLPPAGPLAVGQQPIKPPPVGPPPTEPPSAEQHDAAYQKALLDYRRRALAEWIMEPSEWSLQLGGEAWKVCAMWRTPEDIDAALCELTNTGYLSAGLSPKTSLTCVDFRTVNYRITFYAQAEYPSYRAWTLQWNPV